jgi:hypothetical protein
LNELFVKTQNGFSEIDTNNSNLSLRQRRVLIHVDGKRSIEDIRSLSLVDDLDQVLKLLLEKGLISKKTIAIPSASDPEQESELNFTFRVIPSNLDPKEIGRAKTFMINTLRVFCGEWAHLTIIQAVSDANTHEELRKSFTPWLEAISATKDGQRRIVELSSSLLKDI